LNKIGNRPCWCGASTHHNEEEQLAEVALNLKNDFPNLLTISVPRHPTRADEIQKTFESKGLKVARRSKGEEITNDIDVYLADTIGEMGLLYQLAPIVFVGGSLINFGGQNMLEPMYLSRVVLVGPYTHNFRAFMKTGKEQNALVEVQDKNELEKTVRHYFQNPNEQVDIAQRANQMAVSEMAVLDRLYDLLKERSFV
jgi:3-deoxy-D-manno-octulosonic-acid transferase